jgi:asparagine synthase (glutamine-hydrolysing)
MSGLCGWYQKSTQITANENNLLAMQNKITVPPNLHRTHILTSNKQSHCALALADFTCQSIFNSPQLMVACAGHITWQDNQLTTQAQQQGHAQVIAQLYQRYGTDCLQHIHSDFCLVIIDLTKEQTLLAIDRSGIQRLCFQTVGDNIIFSSDMQAIFEHPLSHKNLSEQGIFNYFYFHMVPSPGAIYNNVSKLLPGQFIIFSNGKITQSFYWKMDYQDNNSHSFKQLKTEFQECLRSSVKIRQNDSTGAFLSGGLDSSTLAGVLSEQQHTTNTFSIGFDVNGYDETPFARTAATHFNTQHHEYYVTPHDVLEAIPLIAKAYDEPFGNASAIPAYYCAKFARESGIKTMIGGDGGDEIFAGNERYAKQGIFEMYEKIPTFLRHLILEPIFLQLPGTDKLPLVKKINSYIKQANTPLPARLETYNFLNQAPLNTIFSNDFLTQVDPQWPLNMQQEVYHRTNAQHSLHKMLHLDMKVTIADNDIRKVNTMCALAGVDVVYPFLDDDMVSFAAHVPPNLKLKGQNLRFFFKQALNNYLPPEIIQKQKHGFGLPFGIWLNDYKPLHDMAYNSLLNLEKRGIFHKNYINHLWQSHKNGHRSYYGVMIWIMMMFEQWLDAHE